MSSRSSSRSPPVLSSAAPSANASVEALAGPAVAGAGAGARMAAGRPGGDGDGGGGGRQPIDRVEQLLKLDRLGHVAVEAGLQATLAVAAHGVGGERHQRQVLARLPLALPDDGRHLETVHLGHLDVHQRHVIAARGERIEGGAAVADDGDGVAHLVEQPQHQPLVDHVVFGEQKTQRVARAPGRWLRDRARGAPRRRRSSAPSERTIIASRSSVLIGLVT